jgi:hypothetical protein
MSAGYHVEAVQLARPSSHTSQLQALTEHPLRADAPRW